MTAAIRLHIGGRQAKPDWKILNINPGDDVDYIGDIRDLSQFADGSCEMVYCSHVLEHVRQRDVLDTLKGIHRVLHDDGKLLVSVPNLDVLCALFVHKELDTQARFHLMRMIYGGDVGDHDLHHVGFNEGILAGFLAGAGFARVNRVENFGIFEDTSSLKFAGVPISLNVEALKR